MADKDFRHPLKDYPLQSGGTGILLSWEDLEAASRDAGHINSDEEFSQVEFRETGLVFYIMKKESDTEDNTE